MSPRKGRRRARIASSEGSRAAAHGRGAVVLAFTVLVSLLLSTPVGSGPALADDDPASALKAAAKEFKTGSVGFYASGKVSNPQGGSTYQVGVNIVLIGSKGGA